MGSRGRSGIGSDAESVPGSIDVRLLPVVITWAPDGASSDSWWRRLRFLSITSGVKHSRVLVRAEVAGEATVHCKSDL